jgi:hypothetical protein
MTADKGQPPEFNQRLRGGLDYLLSEEELDACEAQDLRKLRSVPKGIGQPCLSAGDPKLLLEIPLTVQVLSDQCLTAREDTVMLEPASANGNESVRFDSLLDTEEQLWVILLEPEELLCAGRRELVGWITVEQVQLRGPGTSDLLAGVGETPEPGSIDVTAIRFNISDAARHTTLRLHLPVPSCPDLRCSGGIWEVATAVLPNHNSSDSSTVGNDAILVFLVLGDSE